MQITRGLKACNCFIAAVLSAGLGFATPAFATNVAVIVNPDGKLTYLGTLGGSETYATAINDAGQVAGYSAVSGDSFFHAFITGPNGIGMTDLGTLGTDTQMGWNYSKANSLNKAGQVAGLTSVTGNYYEHAFVTGPNGVGMTNLGTLGGTYSYATGINEAGWVTGVSNLSGDRTQRAFITGPNGVGMTDLGTLAGTTAGWSSAVAINDTGQVVGLSGDDDPYTTPHVFITGPNGLGMTDLGTLSGDDYLSSSPYAVNNAGQITGSYDVNGSRLQHPFITGPLGVGMTDLATPDGDYWLVDSFALAVNDAGRVAGYSVGPGSLHAFITGPNGVGMSDLHSLLDPDGTHYRHSHAVGINNLGQVAVNMTLVSETSSYALMLAGLGLISFMARHRTIA